MRWTLVAQAGHGLPYLPCTAISGRKAVTFSGNFSPASRRSRSVQSRSVLFVASWRRVTSASESRDVRATGESFAAWRIYVLDRRLHGTDDERARERDLPQDLTPHEAVEVLHVNGHVRQLRHPMGE
jgi:hypothetical protein